MTYPDPDLEKVIELIAKLQHWWWSPRHPEFLISRVNKDHASRGMFNLFWVFSGCCSKPIPATPENAVWLERISRVISEVVDGHPLYEWATLLSPREFYNQIVKPWKSPIFSQVADFETWRIKFSAAG